MAYRPRRHIINLTIVIAAITVGRLLKQEVGMIAVRPATPAIGLSTCFCAAHTATLFLKANRFAMKWVRTIMVMARSVHHMNSFLSAPIVAPLAGVPPKMRVYISCVSRLRAVLHGGALRPAAGRWWWRGCWP